ncbi:MAG: hypothetical protein NVSMB9_18710 [Isosphaeraceae bacterium]
MISQSNMLRFLPFGTLLAVLVMGADSPTQTVDAGGLAFQAPKAWKKTDPSSAMRRAQLTIAAAEGDEQDAELVVFAFPGGAGTVDANIERWRRTFKDKDGKPPKVDVKKVEARNTEVTRVEIAGHYFPTTFPGQPKQPDRENYRLLGAIVLTKSTGYFLRLVGPDKTINGAKADFDQLIASIELEK